MVLIICLFKIKLLINILLQTSIKINIVEIEWEFPTLGEIIV